MNPDCPMIPDHVRRARITSRSRSRGERCVLMILASHADGAGWAGPISMDTLAMECGKGPAQTRRDLRNLERLGEIERETREGRACRWRVAVILDEYGEELNHEKHENHEMEPLPGAQPLASETGVASEVGVASTQGVASEIGVASAEPLASTEGDPLHGRQGSPSALPPRPPILPTPENLNTQGNTQTAGAPPREGEVLGSGEGISRKDAKTQKNQASNLEMEEIVWRDAFQDWLTSRRTKGAKKPVSAKRRLQLWRELKRFSESERFGADWVGSRLRQAAESAWQGVIFPEDREALKAWETRGELAREADRLMALSASAVTGVSWDIAANRPSLLATARGLVDAGFAPSVIAVGYRLTEHGAGSPWQSDDWRGRKGDRPTPTQLLETIGGVSEALKSRLERRRWSGLDDVERAAAEALGLSAPSPDPEPEPSEPEPEPEPEASPSDIVETADDADCADEEKWEGPDPDTTWGRVARAAYDSERIGLAALIWMRDKETSGSNGAAEVWIGDAPWDGRMLSRNRGALELSARELGVALRFRNREEKTKQKGGDP